MVLWGVGYKRFRCMKLAIHSPLNASQIRLLPLLLIACFWTGSLLSGAQWAAKGDLSEEIENSQELAIEKYPDLGVANSAFNTTFLRAVKLLREKRPEFFSDPQWPLTLSDAVAVDLKVTPNLPLNSASIQESVENPRAYEELERYCTQSVKKAFHRKELDGIAKDWFMAEDQLQPERIADSLTIAALQSEETFDKILESFLQNMISSAAPKVSAKNKDWIEGVLWRSSSWRCIEKYTEAEQCEILGRLIAKCGNSKLATDWILRYNHSIALRDRSILTESQKVPNRAPTYPIRAGICDQVLSENYHLFTLPINKADFLYAVCEMKMWKVFKHLPPTEWGLLNAWGLMTRLPSAPPSYDQAEWRQTIDQLEQAIQARITLLREQPGTNEPPMRDTFGCFESYLVCSFSEFNGTQEGFEWIDSTYKKTLLSPDPAIRKAAKLVGAFKVAALMWASKQK